MQPLYSPAVNCNLEFSHLGSGQRVQVSIRYLPKPISPHLKGPWLETSAPAVLNYAPPEGMLAPCPSNVGSQSTSSVYMHSSQFSVLPHPAMSFVQPHEHTQSFAQLLVSLPLSFLIHGLRCQRFCVHFIAIQLISISFNWSNIDILLLYISGASY